MSGLPKRPFAERIRLPGWCVLSALIFVFYLWTATSSNHPFQPRDTSHEFYNQLTDSLIQGHLYLNAKPRPELLAFKDPYDPALNERLRLHDASLYRGRYYLYFGAAPALTLYVPWRLLTGRTLSDDVAVTLFCFGGYLFSCLLLFLLLDAADVRVHWLLQAAAVLALGLGQVAPIVLRRPRVYEVAVSSGYCFLLIALYLLARRVVRTDSGRWLPALSAACIGLAVGSRPQSALVATLLAILYGAWLAWPRSLRGRAWLKEYAPFIVPLAVAGLLIGWYNYARFENPLEFGNHFQVGAQNLHARLPTPWLMRLRMILASSYYLLICLPNWKARFPFLDLSGAAQPFGNPDLVPDGYMQEPVGGILILAPLSAVGFALPFLLRKSSRIPANIRATLLSLVACGLIMFVSLWTNPGASGRYGLDFAPSLLVAGIFFCLYLTVNLPRPGWRTAASFITAAGCLWAAAANMAASVNSYGYQLERSYNSVFRSIATRFGAGPDAFMQNVDSLHLEATITFPHARPDSREALLSSGVYEAWDLLHVQYVAGDQAMFSWVHCGNGDFWGPWTPIKPGTPQHLVADYSLASKRYVVKLDGAVVMDFPGTLYPTARDQIFVGKLRAGRFGLRDFSGKLEVPPGGLRFVGKP